MINSLGTELCEKRMGELGRFHLGEVEANVRELRDCHKEDEDRHMF